MLPVQYIGGMGNEVSAVDWRVVHDVYGLNFRLPRRTGRCHEAGSLWPERTSLMGLLA